MKLVFHERLVEQKQCNKEHCTKLYAVDSAVNSSTLKQIMLHVCFGGLLKVSDAFFTIKSFVLRPKRFEFST